MCIRFYISAAALTAWGTRTNWPAVIRKDCCVMSKSILEALFFAKISQWERRAAHGPERVEIEMRIQAEKGYFKENLPPDGFLRLEVLENLYTQASEDEEIAVFSHGFRLGALIMMEILARREDACY